MMSIAMGNVHWMGQGHNGHEWTGHGPTHVHCHHSFFHCHCHRRSQAIDSCHWLSPAVVRCYRCYTCTVVAPSRKACCAPPFTDVMHTSVYSAYTPGKKPLWATGLWSTDLCTNGSVHIWPEDRAIVYPSLLIFYIIRLTCLLHHARAGSPTFPVSSFQFPLFRLFRCGLLYRYKQK